MTAFIGRSEELKGLKALSKKKSASLVVIKGRRRIGKTRLAEEFAKSFSKHYFFAGLAPSQAPTSTEQKLEFSRQMKRQRIPVYEETDWGGLLDDLADHCKKGKTLVVLDEISWMGHGEPSFLAKLKNSWDLGFKKNPQLILILSGSNSTWIEKNILNDTGFVGRISHRLTLEELPLPDCNKFWDKQALQVSAYDKLKVLSVTGGVPRYLEEIDPTVSAESIIKRLCFKREGLLFHEFENIFADSLSVKSTHYRTIVRYLSNKNASLVEIAKHLGREQTSGDITSYLEDLCQVGFVTRDYSWDLQKNRESKTSLFRLSDNYLRFYLRYIEPNQKIVQSGTMDSLPQGWDSIMGLQFENLVLSRGNRLKLYDILEIPTDSIIQANPFLQTETQRRLKCQIDFLIQTKDGSLYICEIKFRKKPLGKEVINDVSEKIHRLKKPKYMSCRPVLIHVNGVNENILKSDFFIKSIDFSEFLN